MSVKYHTYQYNGFETTVGRSRLGLNEGDLYCIIDQTRGRFGTALVADVTFSTILHESDYVGDYTIPEYNVLIQTHLNEKYGLDPHGDEIPSFKYVEPNPLLAGVRISR